MLRLAADENFNNDIVRGLLRRKPDLGIVHIQDVGFSGTDDPTVLEWATQERSTNAAWGSMGRAGALPASALSSSVRHMPPDMWMEPISFWSMVRPLAVQSG